MKLIVQKLFGAFPLSKDCVCCEPTACWKNEGHGFCELSFALSKAVIALRDKH